MQWEVLFLAHVSAPTSARIVLPVEVAPSSMKLIRKLADLDVARIASFATVALTSWMAGLAVGGESMGVGVETAMPAAILPGIVHQGVTATVPFLEVWSISTSAVKVVAVAILVVSLAKLLARHAVGDIDLSEIVANAAESEHQPASVDAETVESGRRGSADEDGHGKGTESD